MRWGLNEDDVSVSTRALSRDFRSAVEAAAAAGFSAVEVWAEDTEQIGGVQPARRLLADCGLAVSSFQVGRDLDGAPTPVFERARGDLARLLEGCSEIGGDHVLFCSSMREDASADFNLAVEQVGTIAADAGRAGIRVAFEALSMARHRRSWTQAWAVVAAVASPYLGIALDTTHCALVRDDVEGIAALPANSIYFVQLADLPTLEGDLLDLNRKMRLFPGEGIIDFEPFMSAVRRTGYAGTVSLEVFNAANMERPAYENARRAMASLRG